MNKLTVWQWVHVIFFVLNLLTLLYASRCLLRYNAAIGFIKVSPKHLARVQTWVEEAGGYNAHAHSGWFMITILCGLILLIEIVAFVASH